MIRKMMRNGSEGANPQKKDAAVNPVTAIIRSRFRPKRPASHPVIGRIMAFATRYDVSVQVASSVLAERLPAMCGSDTLTTVVSSTSMKVLDITAMATTQGFTGGWPSALGVAIPSLYENRRGYRHSRSQQMIGVLTFLKNDLHGNSLN